MTKLLTPSDVPTEYVCRTIKVPNSLEWLGIFNAVMLRGTYYWEWSDDIDTHLTREEAAAAYTAIFSEWLTASMECAPACPQAFRIDAEGRYQYSEDGGETWTSDPEPMGAPDPREEPTDFEKRCAAAANAAAVYRQLYDEAVDLYNSDVEPALALTSLVSGVMLGIFFPPAVPFVEAIFGIAYSVLEYFTSGDFSDEIEDAFKCILIDEANVDGEGVVRFEFEDVRTLVNAKMLESPVWIAISYFLNTFGEDALNRAGATTGVVDPNCDDCLGEWTYRWDFADSDGEWYARSSDEGTWVSGSGWQVECGAGGSANLVVILKELPSIAGGVNSFRALIDYTAGTVPGGEARQALLNEYSNAGGTGAVLLTANAGTPPPNDLLDIVIPDNAAPQSLMINVWTSNGICNGNAFVQSAEISGEGVRPALTGGYFL